LKDDPVIIKDFHIYQLSHFKHRGCGCMIRSYLVSLYRNIVKNKFYSILNVSGLAVGMAAAMLIMLYVRDEVSYDKYNENYDRIYRLESEFSVNNNQDKYATLPNPLGPALKREIPEIEEMTRLAPIGNMPYRYNDIQYIENKFYLADSTLFHIFSFPFINGNPNTCLVQPYSMVLTESVAARYFRGENPMGKILTDRNGNQFKITGVIRDLPGNTHLRFEALISMSTDPETYNTTKPSRFWRSGSFTYILLHKNANIETIYDKFLDFYHSQMEGLGKKYGVSFRLMTTPLANTHFRKGLSGELPTGNRSYILIFSAIALFLLMIAAINYMNMATARSANRAKEVGIRKVMGAEKGQLIRQFLGESIVLSIISLVLALLMVWLILPEFNYFTGKFISFKLGNNLSLYFEIFAVAFLVGILSGSYPAFYLSAFRPIRVLKGNVSRSGKKSGLLRKILVVLQFFIAIVMIIASLVVSGQLRFMKNTDLGFTLNNMIVVEVQDHDNHETFKSFKERLVQNPNIVAASNSSSVAGVMADIYNLKIEQEEGMIDRSTLIIRTDHDFIKTFGMKILNGRDFDKNMGTDALEAVIINETAAREFGWENNPIGKKIHYGFNREGSGGRMLKVIGVVKDFFFKSLHNKIEPVIIFISDQPEDFLTIQMTGSGQQEAIDNMEILWQEYYSAYPFNYRYLTDRMDDMYTGEAKINNLVWIATLIAIFIALLGLMGLSSFTAEQKTKEIGLRKIMGASIPNILILLYKDYVVLIIIAFLLSAPLAWWQLSNWLEATFIYYQPVQISVILIAGLAALIIGLGTVSYFIVRAASRNPVDTIKYE